MKRYIKSIAYLLCFLPFLASNTVTAQTYTFSDPSGMYSQPQNNYYQQPQQPQNSYYQQPQQQPQNSYYQQPQQQPQNSYYQQPQQQPQNSYYQQPQQQPQNNYYQQPQQQPQNSYYQQPQQPQQVQQQTVQQPQPQQVQQVQQVQPQPQQVQQAQQPVQEQPVQQRQVAAPQQQPVYTSRPAATQRPQQATSHPDPYYNYGQHYGVPTNDPENPWIEVYTDTIMTEVQGQTEVRDSILDPLRVVTNKFGKNWFVFGTAGAHSFRGDYSTTAAFSGTISPDWSVGIGKWFTPGIALKLEFIKSNSRGYTEYLTGHYGKGGIKLNDKGYPYRDMETRWWDISASIIFNLTRLFYGYEGYNSPKRMNQVMFAGGFGGVHHLGFNHSYGSDNEWAGHVELQYSRFFTPAKRFSLDLKIRALMYQTNFDLEYGAYDNASNKWDTNIGIDLGFTYYLGKDRANGWGTSVTQLYRRDYRERDILVYRERTRDIAVIDSMPRHTPKTITFYVFYPNNYSGRNDSPLIPGQKVNAIDYLAGGIFTQKRFTDNNAAANVINGGGRTTSLLYEDIPTECASNDFTIDCIQRGYEMSTTVPMSPSMQPAAMNNFYNQAGYYYAPIWDGLHEWHYRIDNATLKQQLVNSNNYYERETYGLNAHAGLETIKKDLETDEGDYLVSFADVYAAINGNTGFISQYTDPTTVEKIKKVLTDGIVTVVEYHGCATSQDNYSGQNAKQVGIERNQSLADCRAGTVASWFKSSPFFKDTKSLIYIDNGFTSAINTVVDASTRGKLAKENRCVKVRIQVIY